MKRLPLLLLAFLSGCASMTAPEMVPDNTTDSVIMMKLKHEILNGDQISQNWGWILWYLPVLFLVVAWAWKEFVKKKDDCDEEETEAPVKGQPAPQDDTTTVP
jgi:hypothetical protein